MTFAYDAVVLIAGDRSERRQWAEHRALLEVGFVPITPAPVVAQARRSSDVVDAHPALVAAQQHATILTWHEPTTCAISSPIRQRSTALASQRETRLPLLHVGRQDHAFRAARQSRRA